jgi:Protein of unknown function (DUF2948)
VTEKLPELRKLIALDADDLVVLAAHLQDAIIRTGDLVFRPQEKRFALMARRFDWEAREQGDARRRLTALHFDRVLAVKSAGIDRAAAEAPLNLLTVQFMPTQEPAGEVALIFSDNAAIRLTVECLEAQMRDMGPIWAAGAVPDHDNQTGAG